MGAGNGAHSGRLAARDGATAASSVVFMRAGPRHGLATMISVADLRRAQVLIACLRSYRTQVQQSSDDFPS